MASIFAGLAVQFADDVGVDVPDEIRNVAFDFSAVIPREGEGLE